MQNIIIFLKFQPVELIIPIRAIACQIQLVTQSMDPSMEFSRQEYWSGVPLLSPIDLNKCL